jgi:putative transposase
LKRNAPEWLPRITRIRGGRAERLFWQSGGGFDRNIVEPRTLMAMIDYIHMNPVRRGLVERPTDWKWSSAGWYAGVDRCGLIPDPIPPEWVPRD